MRISYDASCFSGVEKGKEQAASALGNPGELVNPCGGRVEGLDKYLFWHYDGKILATSAEY